VPKRTRHRHLARQAARRQAERRRRQRRRTAVVAMVAVVALIGAGGAFATFVVGKSNSSATGTPTPSTTVSPTPSGSPGQKIGTVPPAPGPKQVACGGKQPAAATKPKPQFAAPATVIDMKKTYTATIETSCGTIEVRLLPGRAPKTVNSFVFLARKGFFDGIHFHRVAASLDVIQGGDPTGTGSGGPGYTIPDEVTGKETYGPGVVAMAKTAAPNSGGSQFFIVYGPKGHQLDSTPSYTIFGTVVKGLDVVKRIGAIPVENATAGPSGETPVKAIYIEKVTITTSK
jgi:cyclophilin family peptidyl-prolyl cis-trans isomerase